MARTRWHIQIEDATVTVARHMPARFDVAAQTVLPDGSRVRVAQQIRQDIWRVLQALRGFSPTVCVERKADGLHITAGGRIEGRFPKMQTQNLISEVLNNPVNRTRWVRFAGGRHG